MKFLENSNRPKNIPNIPGLDKYTNYSIIYGKGDFSPTSPLPGRFQSS
jgi:hypothetical protein